MRKRRSAGSFLDVLKAQHFDSMIDLTRRVAVKLARYKQTGTTNYDPQVEDGTIGNLVGAFLMQLVASPTTRPDKGHLFGIGGVPAIFNGSGKATPILDAWANKDTDVEPLTVDPDGSSLAAGTKGIILRGTHDDAQDLVFFSGGGGGAGGGGSGTDAIDGNVHLDGSTANFLNGMAPSGTPDNFGIITDPAASRPNVYYTCRTLWLDTLEIDAGVVLIAGHRIYCRTLKGAGTISQRYSDFYNTNATGEGDGNSPHTYRDAGALTVFNGNVYLGVGVDTGGIGGFSPNGPGGTSGLPGIPLCDGTDHAYGIGGKGGDTSGTGTGAACTGGTLSGNFDRNEVWDLIDGALGGSGFGAGAGGTGGEGAGSSGGAPGGSGGAGGGAFWLKAIDMSNFTGLLTVDGNRGQDGDRWSYPGLISPTDNSGGGGGGGGYIVLTTKTPPGAGAWSYSVAGGAGGAKGTGGAHGQAGSAGSAGVLSLRLIT